MFRVYRLQHCGECLFQQIALCNEPNGSGSGRGAEESGVSQMALKYKETFNRLFFDKKIGYYTDGVETNHSSLHANMFALTFDMVPEKSVESVINFVKSRGMVCSVYGSQHLLNAVYASEDDDYGMKLLTSKDDRGWYHAIYNVGTTISIEAWDNKYKPNQDWNHAWGAAPANIIPMQLMGVQPLSPGFGRVLIKPQPSDLEWATLKYPTIRGDVEVSFLNGNNFSMDIKILANMEAQVWIPNDKRGRVKVNGAIHEAKRIRNFYVI
ncbi:MAG: alpha-L-rhamnosidase C-terminal domain-containing protein [Rikenellaceae bacterium]